MSASLYDDAVEVSLWLMKGCPVVDQNTQGRSNFRGCEFQTPHRMDTKTALKKHLEAVGVVVLVLELEMELELELELVVGVGVGVLVKERVCHILFVSVRLNHERDPLCVVEDHCMARDLLQHLYFGTFR